MSILKKEIEDASKKYREKIFNLIEIYRENCTKYNYCNEDDFLSNFESLYQKSEEIENFALQIIESNKLNDLFDNFDKLIIKGSNNIFDSMDILENMIKKFIDIKNELMNQKKEIIDIFIYPVTYSLDITKEWKEHFEKIFDNILNTTLIQLTIIKKINEDDFILIEDILENFTEHHKKSILYNIKYNESLPIFLNKLDIIKKLFIESINKYSENFEKILNINTNINSISEKIRMISLNLSIEASKASNKAFMIIGKELQKLSLETQQFLKDIENESKNLLLDLEKTRNENMNRLEELNNFISIYKNLISEYDNSIKEVENFLTKFINNVKESNNENKNLIFSIFNDIQKISIIKEEINHKDKFLSQGIEKVLNYYNILLKKEDLVNISDEKRLEIYKNLLEMIKTFTTTKEERNFLNELYKKYLNYEIDDHEFKDKDLIIF